MATPEQQLRFTGKFPVPLTDPPDFTIELGKYRWSVHKEVVGNASQFFAKCCRTKLRESAEGKVTLHDDEPAVFAHVLQYFYFNTYVVSETEAFCQTLISVKRLLRSGSAAYRDGSGNVDTAENEKDTSMDGVSKSCDGCAHDECKSLIHATVFQLADKYDIPGLRMLSKENLFNSLDEGECFTAVHDHFGRDFIHAKNELWLMCVELVVDKKNIDPWRSYRLHDMMMSDANFSYQIATACKEKLLELREEEL